MTEKEYKNHINKHLKQVTKVFCCFWRQHLLTPVYSQDTNLRRVTDGENKPLHGANVVIEGSIEGSTADSLGYYEFETTKKGSQTLIFTALEFTDKKLPVNIEAGKPIEANVKLYKSEAETDEILVTASTFTSGQQSQVTITPLEIVRIPGSDADLFRALTTFPGSNQVDEGSRITVRGGDENEGLTILDQASLYHPFIFDDILILLLTYTINCDLEE
jgi:hypothetical protein